MRTLTSRAFRRMLFHTCTIERLTEGALDVLGRPTITWSDLATDVPCNYQPKITETEAGIEVKNEIMATLVTDYIVFIEPRDITRQDILSHIVDADGDVLEEGPFNIRIIERSGGVDHHLEVHCERGTKTQHA